MWANQDDDAILITEQQHATHNTHHHLHEACNLIINVLTMAATASSPTARAPFGCLFALILFFRTPVVIQSAPSSNPYIAYRTSPFDQAAYIDHPLDWTNVKDAFRSQIHAHTKVSVDASCPLQFSLGMSKRPHSATGPAFFTRNPPVLSTIFPASTGMGKQVIYTTQYEHLDVLSPARLQSKTKNVKEALTQAHDFPLLFESSSFHTSPIIHDVNADGIADAIVMDYDGAIVALGLATSREGDRFLHSTQVPRMYVRREWIEAFVQKQSGGDEGTEEKKGPDDPFHSYFDYFYSKDEPDVLRGVTANRLDQDQKDAEALESRRNVLIQHSGDESGSTGSDQTQDVVTDQRKHRRLQEVPPQQGNADLREEQQQEQQQEQPQEETPLREPENDLQGQQQRQGENIADEPQPQQDKPPEANSENNITPDNPNPENQPANEQQGKTEQEIQQQQMQLNTPVKEEEKKPLMAPAQPNNDANLPPEQQPPLDKETDAKDDSMQDTPPREETAQKVKSASKPAENASPPRDTQPQEEPRSTEQEQEQQEEAQRAAEEQHRIEEEPQRVKVQREEELHRHQIEQGDDRPVIDERDRLSANGMLFDDDLYEREKEELAPSEDYPEDDEVMDRGRREDDYYERRRGDDDYAMDDEYGRGPYDDYYGYDESHEEYYDSKHYMRISPHILADPVLVEIPKPYVNTGEVEDILFVPVSYYLDEDEYEGFFNYQRFEDNGRGDENEVRRGGYVASALMAYVFSDSYRWSAQHHLDLSTDWTAPENITLVGALPMRTDTTKMGAFALSSPTVADIDGDGKLEVLIGTSMGMVYAFEARQVFKRERWPIQMHSPVESRILVEDVVGDTKLEVFVADIGGNVVCFNAAAERVWHRNMPDSLRLAQGSEMQASSPLTLGDVDGDGVLDVVTAIRIADRGFVFAFNGATGQDLANFPIELDPNKETQKQPGEETLHQKLAQPLLVDLHADQSHLNDYIRRNGTKWVPRPRKNVKASHGGTSPGLHVVQPYGETIYIIEGGSGCTQPVAVGDQVVAMVQADDVHGTNRIDLVVATLEGKIITLEAGAQWHALNTWNHGELRGRENAHAHGYSASQGIYVHSKSRQFKNILGVYVPITFEIFDNRPNIQNEPDKRRYSVEIRDGTSSKRALLRKEYQEPGIYTERIYIRYGPGYYSLSLRMRGSNGLVYEDAFQVQYNINFMDGFGVLIWLPLLLASTAILLCGSKKGSWDDEEADDARDDGNLGILGRALPT